MELRNLIIEIWPGRQASFWLPRPNFGLVVFAPIHGALLFYGMIWIVLRHFLNSSAESLFPIIKYILSISITIGPIYGLFICEIKNKFWQQNKFITENISSTHIDTVKIRWWSLQFLFGFLTFTFLITRSLLK